MPLLLGLTYGYVPEHDVDSRAETICTNAKESGVSLAAETQLCEPTRASSDVQLDNLSSFRPKANRCSWRGTKAWNAFRECMGEPRGLVAADVEAVKFELDPREWVRVRERITMR